MKFLLVAINAKYIHSNPAIYSLRASAGKEAAEHMELVEYTINQYMQDILADIYEKKPDAIGFSCYIWNWKLIRELLIELPKILPGTDLWLGGPEVSFDADKTMEAYPQLTGIMIGEGEVTFRRVMEVYLCGGNREAFREIPGLCLETGYTSLGEPVDMSSIPFLYENLTPFKNRIIYYETSRGCPFRCSYCLSSIEKSVRLRDITTVKKELQFFLDNCVKQVKFIDRTFNCNHEHAMEIWKYIKEHDNNVTNFHFEISGDILRQDEIELLQSLRPGLVQLEIGVQSTNPDALRAVNRRADTERLKEVVVAIGKGNNIHQHLDLIAGLPYEDYESFARSFNEVYAMRPEQLQLGFLKVLKGSGMWEKAEEYGICYLEEPPYEVLHTKWLSYDEILRLKGIEEMVELYYNSNQFTHTLPLLESRFSTPFAMYEELARFYRAHKYSTGSPARGYRYNALLEFAKETDALRLPLYRELLTFDMYLRENLKSRPEFASDLSPYREAIRSFYQREEEERRYLPAYAGYDKHQLGRMTHLEPFQYPVWDKEFVRNSDEKSESVGYLLFDYQVRNPLNGEAAVQLISFDGGKPEVIV
ncbi:MAG: B12-binding domain-containing radical SAM protein [Acetatifactor sp.]